VQRAALAGFHVAVETNGTQSASARIDWLTVSPKARAN
jgi:organic radical activating enzyme